MIAILCGTMLCIARMLGQGSAATSAMRALDAPQRPLSFNQT